MNAIADDTRKPMDPSGIRFGTPAITTRGFMEIDCALVAELMIDALKNKDNPSRIEQIKNEITQLAGRFPIPDTFVTI